MIDALIAEHAGRIRWGARKQWNRLTARMRRAVDLEDLEQEARIACWQAIVEYDTQRKVPLGAWISWNISRRLIDHLRHIHASSRADGGGTAYPVPEQLNEGLRVEAINDAAQIEYAIDAAKILAVIGSSRAHGGPKNKWIMGRDRELVRLWAEGETQIEIARALGVNQPRVFQIKTRAIERARAALGLVA